MSQELTKIEKLYDTVAKEWAKFFSGEHDKRPKDREILRRFAKETYGIIPVWDFGCGPGNTTRYLKNLGIEISGLDLSEKTLKQARIKHPGINFQNGNILALKFKDDSIAAIVAFYAIVHFTKEQVAITFREVFRVLQPGGIFLFTYHIGDKTIQIEEFLGKEVNIEFMFFTSEFIFNCLENSGFKKIEIIERKPYPEIEYESTRAYVFAYKYSHMNCPSHRRRYDAQHN
jgi:ubiquinone/menaquinone biosynthesis C-methylase UbiE